MGIKEQRKKIQRSVDHLVETAPKREYALRELFMLKRHVEQQLKDLGWVPKDELRALNSEDMGKRFIDENKNDDHQKEAKVLLVVQDEIIVG